MNMETPKTWAGDVTKKIMERIKKLEPIHSRASTPTYNHIHESVLQVLQEEE